MRCQGWVAATQDTDAWLPLCLHLRSLSPPGFLAFTPSHAGWKQVLSGAIVDLPLVRQLVQAQQDKLIAQVRRDMAAKTAAGGAPAVTTLPPRGLAPAEVQQLLSAKVGVGGGHGCSTW